MRRWAFDPSGNRLESENEIARLSGKATDVLDLLVQNQGEVVSQSDILKRVWKNVHVTPDLVREYVFDLRQALGDDAANPRYIETIRGKGFRLIGGVELVPPQVRGAFGRRRARIAVLRPDCFDGGPRWQRFADGLADELITDLARFNDLSVIARVASFGVDKNAPFQETVDRLRCDYVLESSLSVWDTTLRARFQLIDARTEDHVWSDTIERPAVDLPRLSGGIALGVANRLGGIAGAILRAERRYAARRPPSDLSAWENYVIACELEGRYDDESILLGLEHINRSIEIDPDYARSYLLQGFFYEKHECLVEEREKEIWLEKALSSATRAASLDRRDPLILSFAARTYASSGQLAAARQATFRSADLAENESHAALVVASAMTLVIGDYDTADALIETAYELCPDPPDYYSFVSGRNLLFSGRYSEAEDVSFSGPDFESTFVIRCLAQSLQGKTAEARDTYGQLISKYPFFRFNLYPKNMGIVAENTLLTFSEAVERLEK